MILYTYDNGAVLLVIAVISLITIVFAKINSKLVSFFLYTFYFGGFFCFKSSFSLFNIHYNVLQILSKPGESPTSTSCWT